MPKSDSSTRSGPIAWPSSDPESSPPALTYTWTDMFIEQPGLGHMKEIVRTLLREAALSDRVALLPVLRSNSMHCPGPGRVLRWSDYFDWREFPVSDPGVTSRAELSRLLRNAPSIRLLSAESAPVPARDAVDLVVRHFPDSNISNHTAALRLPQLERYEEPGFSDHFPAAVQAAAAAVADEFHPLAGVLHLRRGDLAGPSTAVEAVHAHLAARGVLTSDRVFVMTNERDPAYLRDLRAHFPGIVYEQESRVLQRILAAGGGDNYLAFRIGKCLQKHHDRKGLGTLRFMDEHTRPPAPHRWGLRPRILKRLLSVTPGWLSRCHPAT